MRKPPHRIQTKDCHQLHQWANQKDWDWAWRLEALDYRRWRRTKMVKQRRSWEICRSFRRARWRNRSSQRQVLLIQTWACRRQSLQRSQLASTWILLSEVLASQRLRKLKAARRPRRLETWWFLKRIRSPTNKIKAAALLGHQMGAVNLQILTRDCHQPSRWINQKGWTWI